MADTSLSSRIGPRALVRALAWLRLCAITGQSATILVVIHALGLPLPELALFAGVGVLTLFAVYAAWRLQSPNRITEWQAVVHMAVDTLELCYLLYLTGGASNPFITLLLVPIALSAAALSVRSTLVVATLSGLVYLFLLAFQTPLLMRLAEAGYRLHIAGMAVNFVIMAVLLGVFIRRLAVALRLQHQEVQRVRERALRDEGILAIATQAAGAAHEMNTPLSTMRTLLPELRRDHGSSESLDTDLQVLETQVERCRASLREMVSFGKSQLTQQPERATLRQFLDSCLERFRLLRPEADVDYRPAPGIGDTSLRIQAGLRHALLNLLNNAADASAQNDSHSVRLDARIDGEWLELTVADKGPGFAHVAEPSELGYTRKRGGMGLGLALAEATAERLEGELRASTTATGGSIRLRLPLPIMRPD